MAAEPDALERSLACFVDRTEARRLLLDHGRVGHGLTCVDLRGIEGSGRRLLLEDVRRQLAADEQVAVALVEASGFQTPPECPPERQLAVAFSGFRRLLAAVAGQLVVDGTADVRVEHAAFTSLVEEGVRIQLGDVTVMAAPVTIGAGAHVDVGGSIASAALTVEVDQALVIEESRCRLASAFHRLCLSVGATRRLVVMLAECDAILADLVGTWWFTDVVARLPNALVVAARNESPRRLPGGPDCISIELEELSRDDVLEYLRRRLPDRDELPTLADAIYSFSAGHPAAVSLAVDLVEQDGRRDAPALLAAFDRLPTGRGELLSALVDHIIAGVEEPDVRDALQVAWVARRCDAGLLASLMTDREDDPQDPSRYGRTIDALGDYSFTRPASVGDGAGRRAIRFHEFVRVERDRRLRDTDPERYEELHRRAASYFAARLLSEDSGADETSYQRTLRHDSSDWRFFVREWLYHLSHLDDRRAAGVAVAVSYLRAFYWYGWYQPYSLCDQLLDDWQVTQRTAEDRQWLEALQDFASSYPTVWSRQEADWDALEGTLLTLLTLGDLEGQPEDLTLDQRRLRALVDMFLAQSKLRRRPPDCSGLAEYDEARQLMADIPDEQWLIPWATYWMAASCLECHDVPRAAALCDAALAMGAEQGDEELLAWCWAMRGDIRWRTDDLAGAFRAYLLAYYGAFAFLGLPGIPDRYVRAWYDELCTGLVHRVLRLCRGGRRQDALDACRKLRDGIRPLRTALHEIVTDVDLETLLDLDDVEGLRHGLLLQLPDDASTGDRLAARRSAAVLRRLRRQVLEEDAALTEHLGAGAPFAAEGPCRMTDLAWASAEAVPPTAT